MKKVWIEFQYDIGGLLNSDILINGFGAGEFELEKISSMAIIDVKQKIADEISKKALEERGVDIAVSREAAWALCEDSRYNPKHFHVTHDEINITTFILLDF